LSLVFIIVLLFSVSFDRFLRSDRTDLRPAARHPEINANGKVGLIAVRAAAEPIQDGEIGVGLVRDAFVAPSPASAMTVPGGPMPKITATAALVKDSTGGPLFLVRGPDLRWPIASLTKLLTALVAREAFEETQIITLTEAMLAVEGIAGNFAGGEQYSVADLMKAMLVVSSNDAAEAIRTAYDAAYGPGALVDQMNNLAQRLGMFNASFADATGLSILNQATVRDLAILVEYILETNPDIFAITSKKEVVIREISSGKKRPLLNINPFADETRFVGGKTGFTDDAGGNLISIFAYRDHDIIVITLGSADQEKRFLDTELLYAWLTQT